MSKKRSKRAADKTSAQAALRYARVERFQVGLGYAIVVLAVIGGFVLSFYPRAFGLQDSNPAIGFGLAALAVFRLYALKREIRRQAAEEMRPESSSNSPNQSAMATRPAS